MEILFSASVAQLTFGFSQFELEGFSELQLTASSFYSRLIERNVKGLTFESGRIILSWEHFEEGYRVANDKLNLGLHELAHAFWISYFGTEEMETYFDEWSAAAVCELQSMRLGTDSDFFRDYASISIEEFWACCVECFFEAPIEFRNKLPELYSRVSSILNQDMAERMLGRLN
jgi:Mlc titration factor MtfA (ptsG expression regulator)